MHRTSLNVNGRINVRLDEVSEKFNISKKQLVAKIFMYCHRNLNFNIMVTGELTGYQKKIPGDKWKCLRVDFSDAECDVYFEYKKMFRISLSKLFAVGFVLFFDLIINELSGNSDAEEKENVDILNSYTETKQIMIDFVKDLFRFFTFFEEKTP